MATRTEVRQPTATRKSLRPIGLIMLIGGLVGLGVWFSLDFNAQLHGYVADDSIVSDIVEEDWIGDGQDPETILVIGRDQNGNIIWEGSEEEWYALNEEAWSEYQADLRNTWLYPSAAIGLIGLFLVIFGRRRVAPE